MRSFESSSEVHQLVDALSEQLSRVPPADVDSRLVATSLYGAQSLSDSDSLRSLIKTVSLKLAQAEGYRGTGRETHGSHGTHSNQGTQGAHGTSHLSFSGQDISNALLGLQNCADSAEVHGLVRSLLPKITAARKLTDQSFANMLYGTRRLADSALTRSVLALVTESMRRSNVQFAARAWGMCVYGLNNRADNAEVRSDIQYVSSPK
jgi:hypothetical protein